MKKLLQRKPSLDDFRAWLEEELDCALANFRTMNADGHPEMAKFYARRHSYLDATTDVLAWFEGDEQTPIDDEQAPE